MRLESSAPVVLLLACGALLAGEAGALGAPPARPGGAQPDHQQITGQVVDRTGKPVAGVLLFAADRLTEEMKGMAVSDASGGVRLRLPPGPHNFGVFSSSLGPLAVLSRGPLAFQLIVAPLGVARTESADRGPAIPLEGGGARVVRGRVVDELGVGLRGVLLEARPISGAPETATVSDADGSFALPVRGGLCDLRAHAPGLKAMESHQRGGRWLIVMAIAAEADAVVVSDGHVLRFDPRDSIDPEYTPPAAVRAWLLQAHGICPSTAPLRAWERRALRKYWYLDLLRQRPPNPASLSTAECIPAQLQPELLPPETVKVQGFVTWRETVRRPE